MLSVSAEWALEIFGPSFFSPLGFAGIVFCHGTYLNFGLLYAVNTA